jgi:hypothetical protein
MRVTQRALTAAAILALLATIPALAQDAERTPATTKPESGQGDRLNRPATGQPLATAKQESGLLVEILEAKADSNELLTLRWRYRNPTDRTIELFVATPPAPYAFNAPKNIPLRFYPSVYYVEGKFESAKALKHYIVMEEGTKKRYAKDLGRAAVKLRPNGQFEIWAKFSLPKSGPTISLVLPNTPVIENLAVSGRERESGRN